jgi:hypothetical protein
MSAPSWKCTSANCQQRTVGNEVTGTGTAAIQQTVSLTWTASADTVSYNMYRSTTSGSGYTMINTSPNTTTAYTDSTVVSGTTYYYVTTAVDASSEESGYSITVQTTSRTTYEVSLDSFSGITDNGVVSALLTPTASTPSTMVAETVLGRADGFF